MRSGSELDFECHHNADIYPSVKKSGYFGENATERPVVKGVSGIP